MQRGIGKWRSAAFVLRCLLACLLPASGVAAATLSLCESGTEAEDAMARTELYAPGGALVALTLNEGAGTTDCLNLELPVPAAAVRWFALSDVAPAAPPSRIALQGLFDGGETVVSEVIHAGQPAAAPAFLPFGENLLPYLTRGTFGVEERSRIAEDGSIVCAAGAQAAGAYLRADLPWESLAGMQLELVLGGSGEFTLGIADRRREESEAPLELGTVRLESGASTTVRHALPANPEPWSSLTVLCPREAAALKPESLRLLPPAADGAARPRATWLWSPALWQETPERIWEIAQAENLSRIYVTVPVTAAGAVEHADALASFITAARERDLEVWAVLGDPHDVLLENRALLQSRVEAYRAFNASHAGNARLGGVQLDVEPYLLPGFALDPAFWRERYLDMVDAVHERLGQELALDLVMPYWWGSHPAWGAALLEGLVKPGLSITVMNYRTTPEALRAGAMPFLVWGQARRVRVNIALESGSSRINAGSDSGRQESRLGFAAANAGELWLFELDGLALLVLLDGEYRDLPGRAYRRTDQSTVASSGITFAASPERLEAMSALMEAEWSEWAAFAGLAIHGIEENWLRRDDDENP